MDQVFLCLGPSASSSSGFIFTCHCGRETFGPKLTAWFKQKHLYKMTHGSLDQAKVLFFSRSLISVSFFRDPHPPFPLQHPVHNNSGHEKQPCFLTNRCLWYLTRFLCLISWDKGCMWGCVFTFRIVELLKELHTRYRDGSKLSKHSIGLHTEHEGKRRNPNVVLSLV